MCARRVFPLIATALVIASCGSAGTAATRVPTAATRVPTAATRVPTAATRALEPQCFADGRGDVSSVPDIVGVCVRRPTDAQITFAVEFAMAPPLASDESNGYTDMLMIGIDTGAQADESPAPAGSTELEGADFVVAAHGANLSMGPGVWSRRTGVVGPFADEPPIGTTTVDGRTLALTVPASVIGDPAEFGLRVIVGREWLASPQAGAEEERDMWPDRGPLQHVSLPG